MTGRLGEYERRRRLWRLLEPEARDRAEVPAQRVRAVGLYNIGRGIFVDLRTTRESTGTIVEQPSACAIPVGIKPMI